MAAAPGAACGNYVRSTACKVYACGVAKSVVHGAPFYFTKVKYCLDTDHTWSTTPLCPVYAHTFGSAYHYLSRRLEPLSLHDHVSLALEITDKG